MKTLTMTLVGYSFAVGCIGSFWHPSPTVTINPENGKCVSVISSDHSHNCDHLPVEYTKKLAQE